MCNQCDTSKIREARENLKRVKSYIEGLPAEIYNNNTPYFNGLLDQVYDDLDNLLFPQDEDLPRPVIITGGEILEVEPYRAASADMEEDMPF